MGFFLPSSRGQRAEMGEDNDFDHMTTVAITLRMGGKYQSFSYLKRSLNKWLLSEDCLQLYSCSLPLNWASPQRKNHNVPTKQEWSMELIDTRLTCNLGFNQIPPPHPNPSWIWHKSDMNLFCEKQVFLFWFKEPFFNIEKHPQQLFPWVQNISFQLTFPDQMIASELMVKSWPGGAPKSICPTFLGTKDRLGRKIQLRRSYWADPSPSSEKKISFPTLLLNRTFFK